MWAFFGDTRYISLQRYGHTLNLILLSSIVDKYKYKYVLMGEGIVTVSCHIFPLHNTLPESFWHAADRLMTYETLVTEFHCATLLLQLSLCMVAGLAGNSATKVWMLISNTFVVHLVAAYMWRGCRAEHLLCSKVVPQNSAIEVLCISLTFIN